MRASLLLEIVAWAAYLSSTATILTFISGILFFRFGKWLGKANDIFSVFQVLLMIPLVFLFNSLMTPPRYATIIITSLFGLGGMLISAYGQIRLIIGAINFAESQKYFPAGGAIGFWIILANIFSISSGELPTLMVLTGIGAGAGYLLIAGGFLKGGQNDPVFYIGSLMVGICYPVWGYWMGAAIHASLG